MNNYFSIEKLVSIEPHINSDVKGRCTYAVFVNGKEIGNGSAFVNYWRIFTFEININQQYPIKEIGFNLLERMFNDLNNVYSISSIEMKIKKNETDYSFWNSDISNDTSSEQEAVNQTYQTQWIQRLGFKLLEIESQDEENIIMSFYLDRSKNSLVGSFHNKYIDTSRDEGTLYVVSNYFYKDSFEIKPSEIDWCPNVGELITFNIFKDNIPINLKPFDWKEHGLLLDLEKLKEDRCIEVYTNLKNFDFIFDNNIFKPNKLLNELSTVRSIIRGLRNIKKGNIIDEKKILNHINDYRIELYESGKNKPADYSYAGITLDTFIRKFGNDYYLDPYLKSLLPVFQYDFGFSYDLYPNEYKSDIVKRLISDLGGEEKYNEIKSIVNRMSQCVRDYALTLYSVSDHLKVLDKEELRIKNEILNK